MYLIPTQPIVLQTRAPMSCVFDHVLSTHPADRHAEHAAWRPYVNRNARRVAQHGLRTLSLRARTLEPVTRGALRVAPARRTPEKANARRRLRSAWRIKIQVTGIKQLITVGVGVADQRESLAVCAAAATLFDRFTRPPVTLKIPTLEVRNSQG